MFLISILCKPTCPQFKLNQIYLKELFFISLHYNLFDRLSSVLLPNTEKHGGRLCHPKISGVNYNYQNLNGCTHKISISLFLSFGFLSFIFPSSFSILLMFYKFFHASHLVILALSYRLLLARLSCKL